MILLQAQTAVATAGAVTTDWSLTVAISIIGALLLLICTVVGWVFVSKMENIKDDFTSIKNEIKNEFITVHNRIDKRAEENEKNQEQVQSLTTRVILMERGQKDDIAKTAQQTAEQMILKLRAITPQR